MPNHFNEHQVLTSESTHVQSLTSQLNNLHSSESKSIRKPSRLKKPTSIAYFAKSASINDTNQSKISELSIPELITTRGRSNSLPLDKKQFQPCSSVKEDKKLAKSSGNLQPCSSVKEDKKLAKSSGNLQPNLIKRNSEVIQKSPLALSKRNQTHRKRENIGTISIQPKNSITKDRCTLATELSETKNEPSHTNFKSNLNVSLPRDTTDDTTFIPKPTRVSPLEHVPVPSVTNRSNEFQTPSVIYIRDIPLSSPNRTRTLKIPISIINDEPETQNCSFARSGDLDQSANTSEVPLSLLDLHTNEIVADAEVFTTNNCSILTVDENDEVIASTDNDNMFLQHNTTSSNEHLSIATTGQHQLPPRRPRTPASKREHTETSYNHNSIDDTNGLTATQIVRLELFENMAHSTNTGCFLCTNTLETASLSSEQCSYDMSIDTDISSSGSLSPDYSTSHDAKLKARRQNAPNKLDKIPKATMKVSPSQVPLLRNSKLLFSTAANIDSFMSYIQELQSSDRDLRKRIKETQYLYQERRKLSKATITDLKSKISNLEHERMELKQQALALETEVSYMKQIVVNQENDIQIIKTEIESLVQERDFLQNLTKSQSEEIIDAQTKIKELLESTEIPQLVNTELKEMISLTDCMYDNELTHHPSYVYTPNNLLRSSSSPHIGLTVNDAIRNGMRIEPLFDENKEIEPGQYDVNQVTTMETHTTSIKSLLHEFYCTHDITAVKMAEVYAARYKGEEQFLLEALERKYKKDKVLELRTKIERLLALKAEPDDSRLNDNNHRYMTSGVKTTTSCVENSKGVSDSTSQHNIVQLFSPTAGRSPTSTNMKKRHDKFHSITSRYAEYSPALIIQQNDKEILSLATSRPPLPKLPEINTGQGLDTVCPDSTHFQDKQDTTAGNNNESFLSNNSTRRLGMAKDNLKCLSVSHKNAVNQFVTISMSGSTRQNATEPQATTSSRRKLWYRLCRLLCICSILICIATMLMATFVCLNDPTLPVMHDQCTLGLDTTPFRMQEVRTYILDQHNRHCICNVVVSKQRNIIQTATDQLSHVSSQLNNCIEYLKSKGCNIMSTIKHIWYEMKLPALAYQQLFQTVESQLRNRRSIANLHFHTVDNSKSIYIGSTCFNDYRYYLLPPRCCSGTLCSMHNTRNFIGFSGEHIYGCWSKQCTQLAISKIRESHAIRASHLGTSATANSPSSNLNVNITRDTMIIELQLYEEDPVKLLHTAGLLAMSAMTN